MLNTITFTELILTATFISVILNIKLFLVNDIKFKEVTFVVNGDIANGHYFYDVTLPEALQKMKDKGIDVINNFKMNISVYPY